MSCESPSFFSGAEVSAVSAVVGLVRIEFFADGRDRLGRAARLERGELDRCFRADGRGRRIRRVLGRNRFGGDLDRQARVRHRLPDRTGRWRHLLGRRRHGLDVALGLCALGLGALGLCALDRFALHLVAGAVACALPARVPAPGAMVGLGLGRALRALVLGDQRLPVGDRNLIVVGMDFAEGKKAVAIAAVVDEGGLQ